MPSWSLLHGTLLRLLPLLLGLFFPRSSVAPFGDGILPTLVGCRQILHSMTNMLLVILTLMMKMVMMLAICNMFYLQDGMGWDGAGDR